MDMTGVAGNEVWTKVAVSRTEDDLVMLCSLNAVLHQIAVDTHITITVLTAVSFHTNVHSMTAQTC